MAYSRRKKIIKIILHVFGVLLFVVATSYALLAAYGYQIDLLHRNIVKTSIIDIDSRYPAASLFIDDVQVAKKLPFQVESIEPGTYSLTVTQEEFHTWHRTVDVLEDVVTIVDDVYLVPIDIDAYRDTLSLQFAYDETFVIRDTVFFVDLGERRIYRANMTHDTLIFNEIEIPEDIVYNRVYPVGAGYLAFDSEDRAFVYEIDTKEYNEILIPDEFKQFTLLYRSSLQGIYENNGSLFVVDISDKGVFQEITLLHKLDEQVDLQVQSVDAHVLVMLNDTLYEYKDHRLLAIDTVVSALPHVSPHGDALLYQTKTGEVYVYSFEMSQKNLIARFADKSTTVKWLSSGKHFLLMRNNAVHVCDMMMDNCPVLFSRNFIRALYVMQTKPLLIVINKEGIERIDLTFGDQ
ncbi:PEGA domain-containing protein [Candidatus Peregrinibacteria bacterium]|nr:PEGA domain-containing protein [Candidatus Peregrinibacteria bacterium]